MGTTVVCALVRNGRAYICHAGDSRAYLFHAGRLCQLTHDHSYVQELVDCGTITPEEAEHHPQKNIITRALGVDYRLSPDCTSVVVVKGDLLLLCSDGLTNAVPLKEIEAMLGKIPFYDLPDRLIEQPTPPAAPTTSPPCCWGWTRWRCSAMDNLIGRKLDGLYEVRELIGAGGMANVYKAVVVGHNGPVPEGTVVAVKVLRAEFMHDPDLVNRFKNESKAISLLHHPNIVKVYDVSVTDRLQYIVMEYVNGMTLREYLNERGGASSPAGRRSTSSPRSCRLWTTPTATGVVHRDIKPPEHHAAGQRPAADDGFRHRPDLPAENQLLAGKAMGSVHYISPEQARGEVTGPRATSTRWAS